MKQNIWMLAAALTLGMATTEVSAQDPVAVKNAANDSVANAPIITFDKTTHDFGTFPEENGKVTCTFSFKNTGKSDLVLQKVRASCGCTTPNWTKTPIAPGDTGFVTATYNASGRPGRFNKTITVTSNADANLRLTIKGEVIPRVKSPEEEYSFNIGDFRLKTLDVYMRTIEYPTSKTEKIQVMNNGDKDIELTFPGAPKYLTIKANPAKLAPKQKGTLEVTLNSQEANNWGETSPSFNIAVNGQVDKSKKVNVHSTIRENFGNMTPEEKAKAPVLEVNANENIGTIDLAKKKKVVYKINVTNNGKSDLILRKVKSNSSNLKFDYPSKPIKAGKKATIQVTLSTENQKAGKFNYRATIICNDPNHSTTGVTLTGEYK
ncbi:MAG: DUF1573 domain-containing protein [Paludibacteraceae bacterium]|nr:DUF1573 domain-containing protein [Candidatus Physcocola equi]MCQ2234036.1 DUF1573 domain-containing protein [Paludibacteraceae bacterium]